MVLEDRKKVIEYIFSKGILHVDFILEKISRISIQAIGVNNTLKGYIINIKNFFHLANKRYIFFVYSKIPGKLFFFLSDDEYSSLEKCQEDLKYYIKLFPLYGFRKSHCMTNI